MIGGIFGLLCVFMFPPMQIPDEQTHMYKAYQTADFAPLPEKRMHNGRLAYGHMVPTSIIKMDEEFRNPVAGNPNLSINTALYKKYLNTPLLEHDKTFRNNEAGNSNSAVVYLPQALGIGIAKVFDAPPLVLVWLGRLTNLMVWLTLIFFAIKLLPFAQWGLVVLALNPIAVTLAASLSSDAFSIGIAAFFIALLLHAVIRKGALGWNLMGALGVVSVLLAVSKPTNMALLPLLAFIPHRAIHPKLAVGWLVKAAIIIIPISLGIMWNVSMAEVTDAGSKLMRPGVVDSQQQLRGIIHDPLHYMKLVVKNYITVDPETNGDTLFMSYAGVFGWFDSVIPLWMQVCYYVAIVLAFLYQFGRGVVFDVRLKLAALTSFMAMVMGSILAMYLNSTPVGSVDIQGMQGRYFIPVSPILTPLFTSAKKLVVNYEKQYVVAVVVLVVTVLSGAMLEILRRYY